MRQFSLESRQRGVVMLVALILMVMMLLVAVASFNMGRQNTIIAANMQHKAEVVSSANQAVEAVISKTDFIVNPAAALPDNQASYDVNGDGTSDIAVTLSPAPCVKKAKPIKNAELDINNTSDAACIIGANQNLGVEGAVAGDSLCAETVWEINAVATDEITGAAATVTTGVGVRVAADDAKNPAHMCP